MVPSFRSIREALGLTQRRLAALVEVWLHDRTTDSEPLQRYRYRWHRYRLPEPGFSPSLLRKLEKSGRASAPRVDALLDFLTERYGLDRSHLEPSSTKSPPYSAERGSSDGLIPRQLPMPPSDFIGRSDELGQLVGAVEAGVNVLGIFGLGGVGKSALAARVCQILATRYPDGQLYIGLRSDARDASSVDLSARRHVIRSFLPATVHSADEAQVAGMYRTVLNHRRALVLVDDVCNEQDVELLMPPPNCLLVFTSRLQFAVPGLKWVRLGPLPASDAETMFATVAGRKEEARELAELCGGLPLAMRLVGSRLAVGPQLRPSDLVRSLQSTDRRADLVEDIVHRTCDDMRAELRRSWVALAVFRGPFDTQAAAAVWQVEAAEAAARLTLLYRHSLVEWRAHDDRHCLHDLVRLAAERQLQDAAPRQQHARYFIELFCRVETDYQSGAAMASLAAYDQARADIDAAVVWACDATRSGARNGAEALAPLWRRVAGRWRLTTIRLLDSERLELWQMALAAARLLDDRLGETIQLGRVGTSQRAVGNPQGAMSTHLEMLRRARDLKLRDLEGMALGSLGRTCHKTSRPRRAVPLLRAALAIASEIGDTTMRSWLLDELGVTLAHLKQLDEARRCFDERLTLVRDSGDLLGESWALTHLGVLDTDTGQLDRAVARFQAAATVARRIGDRHTEAYVLCNQAMVYGELGQHEHALELITAAIDMEVAFTDRWLHSNILVTRASLWVKLGRPREARADLGFVLAIEGLHPRVERDAQRLLSELDQSPPAAAL